MKKLLVSFVLATVFSRTLLFAAAQSPTPTPTPSPAPAATKTPAPVRETKRPAAEKSPTPTTRATVDSLSASELQEALNLLKANFLNPGVFTEQEFNRATMQGLLERLAPGALILTSTARVTEEPSPFRAEILDDRIGYLRLGSLSKNNLTEMDAALQNFSNKSVKSVILDLRATPPSSDFDLAGEVIKRFCPKGKMLFAVKKPSAKQERILTSNQDPSFRGLIATLVNRETAGAAEVIAASLRLQANALVVGQNTSGRAVEYADLPLQGGKMLRVAVAEITLPENNSIFPQGVKPDLAVDFSTSAEREVLRLGLENGASQFVFDSERPKMNEAALVAGTNPEVDAAQASQQQGKPSSKNHLRDVVLQRAVDLLTTIGIYQKQPLTN